MRTIQRNPNQFISTSAFSCYINSTANKISEVFGFEPEEYEVDETDKTSREWTGFLITDDNAYIPFTVYDYDVDNDIIPMTDEEYDYHIGARNKKEALMIVEYFNKESKSKDAYEYDFASKISNIIINKYNIK